MRRRCHESFSGVDRLAVNSSCLLLFAIISILCSGCGLAPVIGGPVNQEKLVDGFYEDSYEAVPNKAVVKVTIKDNKIVNIQILKHRAWKGKKAESVIPRIILEKQSTEVDAVSGATYSSRVIMNAVQRAIERACQE